MVRLAKTQGMGLSIVAAKGVGKDRLGIYIKVSFTCAVSFTYLIIVSYDILPACICSVIALALSEGDVVVIP
jgi:hypothetical protein